MKDRQPTALLGLIPVGLITESQVNNEHAESPGETDAAVRSINQSINHRSSLEKK